MKSKIKLIAEVLGLLGLVSVFVLLFTAPSWFWVGFLLMAPNTKIKLRTYGFKINWKNVALAVFLCIGITASLYFLKFSLLAAIGVTKLPYGWEAAVWIVITAIVCVLSIWLRHPGCSMIEDK